MELLPYILTNIVTFLGLISGIVLYYIAPEEMPDGEKYLIFMRNVVIALITYFLVALYVDNIFLKIVPAMIVFLTLTYADASNSTLFVLLALPFYFSSPSKDAFFIQSCLIMLSGFVIGSLLVHRMKKRSALAITKKVLPYVPYIILSLMMFFI
jgi:polyferredoxin